MRRRLILGLAILCAIGVAAAFLPLGSIAMQVVTWVRGAGAAGVLLFALAYVVAILLFLPGGPLAIAAGFVYGPVWGVVLAAPVIVFASGTAFSIGRLFLRPWAARRIAESPRLIALDEAVERAGFRTILLLRFAPIMPFNVLQYVLGASRLKLRDFAAGTLFGTLPLVIVFTQVGARLSDITQLGSISFSGPGLWIGLAVSLVAIALAVWVVRRGMQPQPTQPDGG